MHAKRTIVCPSCGTELPRDSAFCTACGEKVVIETKTSSFSKKRRVIAIVLSIVMVMALITNGLLIAQVIYLQDKFEALKDQIKKDNASYEMLLESYNRIKSENNRLKSDNRDDQNEILWYKRNIAFVVEGSDYYHTSDCYKFKEADSYWAYNVEAAEARGYYECPLCHYD